MQNKVFKKNNYTWGGMKQALTKAIKKELGSNYFRALDDFLELKGYKNLKELLDTEKIVIIRKGNI